MQSNKLYALVGRQGDDGGRYTSRQWKQMKERAWRMNQAGDTVQVWLALSNGDLLKYNGDATRRVTDYIVAAKRALIDKATQALVNLPRRESFGHGGDRTRG